MPKSDLLKILEEVRGTGAPEAEYTDGIYWELTQKLTNNHQGVYGDIKAIHSVVTATGETTEEVGRETIAAKMTVDSYVTAPEDTFVKVWTANEDGTFSSVDTTEYSALHHKAKAEAAEASIAPHYAAIEAVNINEVNVTTVADNTLNISAVASIDTDVTTVAANIIDINTIATDITNVTTVAENNENITTVALNDAIIKTVSSNVDNITTAASGIADINIVAEDITNINTVALGLVNIDTVAANDANIKAIVTNDLSIVTVATDISNINTVALDLVKIDTVADNKENIDVVASNNNNINIVASDIDNVKTVATSSVNVDTVASDILNVDTAAINIQNINTVALNDGNIRTVSANDLNITKVANIDNDVTKVSSIDDKVVVTANNSEDISTTAINIGSVNIIGSDLSNEYSYIEDNGFITEEVTAATGTSIVKTVSDNIGNINAVGADLALGVGTNSSTDSTILNALNNANIAITKANEAAASAASIDADDIIHTQDSGLANAGYTKIEADTTFAAVNGNSAQIFKVADAVNADEALSKGQLLTEIKAVGGAGSGLDADTVDGIQGELLGVGGAGYVWVDETDNRESGTTYTNTTGKAIQLYVCSTDTDEDKAGVEIDGVSTGQSTLSGSKEHSLIVPNESTYSFDATFAKWLELK